MSTKTKEEALEQLGEVAGHLDQLTAIVEELDRRFRAAAAALGVDLDAAGDGQPAKVAKSTSGLEGLLA